jgi:DNA-binding CsgD family transcriptional regulator
MHNDQSGDTHRRAHPTWRTHAVFAAVANTGLIGLWAFTRDRTPSPGDEGAGYWWPLWTALLWGLLVGVHYLYTSGRPAPAASTWHPEPLPAAPEREPEPEPEPEPAAPLHKLTRREQEVLALVAQGHPNKAIAQRLYISERTTRTHVSNILRKLDLPSRTQAALFAVQNRGGDAT